MTLNEPLLQKLSDWRPTAGRQLLTVPDEGAGWSTVLTADRSDVLGCLLWELTLKRTNPPATDGAALQAWAERAAARATGLLEPLKVVEVDVQRGEALLRSQEPTRRGDNLLYYEALLRGSGSVLFRRYQAPRQPEGKREQIAFALTHEVVAKVAADLTTDQ